MHETPAARPPVTDPRTLAIWRLGRKLKDGTAGLDPYDAAVMIVEIPSPDRASWIDLIGELLITHPFTRADGSHHIYARAIIEADVRILLRLDEPGAPMMDDSPLASRRRATPLALAPPLAAAAYATATGRSHR